MIWGYHRTSTEQQHLDRGIAEIVNYIKQHYTDSEGRTEKYKIFTDQQTGKNFDRKQYPILKEVVSEGDELIITEIDRLGRNKKGNLDELKYFKEKGVRVKILEIPTTLIDYSSMDNKLATMMMETVNNLLIEVYSTLAEAEMEKRIKRQREGIEQMKARGEWDKDGRPEAVNEKQFISAYKAVENGEITATECWQRLGIGKTTFYKLKKRYIV